MLHQVACRDAGLDCDFVVKDENESELIEIVQLHADGTHHMSLGAKDVRGLMKRA